ncbi:MAG: CDP-diacylglycerol--serine O-phosphatidyltransferase [Proteobacteria bacterium]|nr:CDP-diacylglycerol--serine O-phosphatidyltransferase [Pseudomonadota bacterium]
MIRHFLNPPNWFTSASIFCSVYAMTLLIGVEADSETLRHACVLVVFGGIFDMLDGRVARRLNRYSEFGVQLDSIADIISFGVAPGLLVWSWLLHELGGIGAFMAFWYVLCAAFRLARFNVNTQNNDWEFAGHSQGLTSTMGGGSLVTFVWLANGYLEDVLVPTAWQLGVLTLAIGFLMVSSIPYRNFKDYAVNRKARRFFALALAACLGGALFAKQFAGLFGVGAFLYMTVGTFDGVFVAVWRRLGGLKLPGDDEEAELDRLDMSAADD